jgi:catechol 2,3-dioxygenase-like lactoylglutathione lyase family enzyme
MLAGFNHVATITDDLDRLMAFYREVLGATIVADLQEDGLRHAFIQVGESAILHPFELPQGMPGPPARGPIFQRGRIDHLAINAASEEDFHALRARLVEAGAGDGAVIDFGPLVSTSYEDPDGLDCEICWLKPGFADIPVRTMAEAKAAQAAAVA